MNSLSLNSLCRIPNRYFNRTVSFIWLTGELLLLHRQLTQLFDLFQIGIIVLIDAVIGNHH